jgi:serine phosphatase RsbU (regulator of sigma subunit)/PAS domain-containing protein
MSNGERIEDLAARRDALRQAASAPGTDPGALLDAALTELDAAIDSLADTSADVRAEDGAPEVMRAERRLLHTTFQQAPVPLFLLEPDGTIRRGNVMASELLGTHAGYATGKPLTMFVDLPLRAAVQTQIAAVARTGQPRRTPCRLLAPEGTTNAVLALAPVDLPGEVPLLVAAVTRGVSSGTRTARSAAPREAAAAAGSVDAGESPAAATAAGDSPDPAPGSVAALRAVRALTSRNDTIMAVTRLLLDNSMFSEAVTLQRCARLLAGEFADWVIIDVARDGGGLRRQIAVGPDGAGYQDAARTARSTDPAPSTLPGQVHDMCKPDLRAHVADPAAFGTGPDGTPLLMAMGVVSLLCVPITDRGSSYGALTLGRLAHSRPFDIADLALAEELGADLGIAMRVDRMFRRRSQTAETLQASLFPHRLPAEVPGLEFAAAYVGATRSEETSGDFYDVFALDGGWAVAVGDVCGRGQDAAAMTAAARHTIRALAHVPAHQAPADVLGAASEVLLAGDYGERFVTASLAFLRCSSGRGGGRKVTVRLGGAGHPGPAILRADGRVEILDGGGLPLGLLPDGAPGATAAELVVGDVLFFYTDGVTEARSGDGQAFFDDRLTDSLAGMAGRSAAEIVRAVQDLVTEFSGGEIRDDVTLLAVRAC